jgi:Zn-dependent peptidase ImmA (M78 family)
MRKKVKKKRSKPSNFTFKNGNGVEYEVLYRQPNTHHYGEADGTCADPEVEEPKIHINPYLTKRNELNTIIHEFSHAFFWDKSEKEIYKFANTLSKFLYLECNWRKLERSKDSKYKGK